MIALFHIFGLCARLLATPRAIAWAKRLPFFAAALIVSLVHGLALKFFLYHPNLLTFERWANTTYAILRIGAYLEALWWLFQTIQGFRIGWLVFGLATAAGVGVQFAMSPIGTYLEAYRIPAMLERSTGVGVAVALVVGIAFFDLLGGFSAPARWHSVTVAAWGVLDAAGWAVITNGLPYHGSALIIAGAIICPLLWLAKVTAAPPPWGQQPPPDDPDLVDAAEEELRRGAGL